MRTRKQHIAHVSTAEAVSAAKSGSWAATAVLLGFVPQMGVTLSAVARSEPSAVTLEGENLIRAALGLAPLDTVRRPGKPRSRPRYIRPCLSADPAIRVNQLARLLGDARRALPDASTKECGQTYTWQPGGWVDQYCQAEEEAWTA